VSRPWQAYTDKQLADYAKTGSNEAYREFLRRYKPSIYRLISSQIGDPDEALDLTQEAFVSAFSAISRYDGERPFRVWMARIAINKCRDWARRRKVRAFFSAALPLDLAFNVKCPAPLPDEAVEMPREANRVRDAIAKLPDNLREVLVLRAVEEMSQAEVAMLLKVSEKTVETRLYRARLKLREILGPAQD
jgi:RNA polymerase sigma factor (sigma-70 family)